MKLFLPSVMQSNAFKIFFLHLQEDIQVVVFAVQEEGYSSTSVQGLGQKGMKRGDLERRVVLRIRFEFFFFLGVIYRVKIQN